MRLNLLFSLSACFCFAACADHAGSVITANNNPQAPINQPDSGTVAPGLNPETGNQDGGSNGSGSGGAGSGGAGSGGSGGGSGGSGGGAPPSGGGQPVPEPGTLLLVGTGLAGAALLRRRRTVKA